MSRGVGVAFANEGTVTAKANAMAVTRYGTTLQRRRGMAWADTYSLWQGGGVMRRHFLTYLALSTMAVAQPVLDLYGKNPTIFSASKMSTL